jgi:ubiquinone/menaquinone biosynthesis C-methylase UbiE
VFDKHAKHYQEKFRDVSLYAKGFDIFCDAIKKKNAEILELACGPGNITSYLLNKRPDLKILGTDLAPNMLELAKKDNPAAEFQLMDARDILKLNKNYDGIMCGFCLPYLDKEEANKLFQDCYAILNPGGILYISTMEDEYSKSGIQIGSKGDEIFMHFYEGAFLKKILEENNFKVLNIERIDSLMGNGSKVVDLVIMATKQN